MNIDKSYITNLSALSVATAGYYFQNPMLLNTGLFALSGSVTNSIAIHMLFEKVRFFYGSGVVESRFEEFKSSIKDMMMAEFFTSENIQKIISQNTTQEIDLSPIVEKTDFSIAFESLKKTVIESSFGSMLSMFGGEQALNPMQQPFEENIKSSIIKITKTSLFQTSLRNTLNSMSANDTLMQKIEIIIENRLNELNAKIVKEIISNMIRKHLGWLVVWGGLFGGLIGLVSSFLV